tara:strand:+ start:640 stop:870 length:231 start_codon:yes stop_codon:yes gene_type:complete
MVDCKKILEEESEVCSCKGCKLWIEYSEDCNCINVSIKKHGRLTLQQVGWRLGVSHVRIKQIQDRALKKLKNKVRA